MARVEIEIRDTANDVVGILDVGDSNNFPLSLTKKLSDLATLTARSGVFSTTFKVPASKNNDQLLEYLYNSNKRDTHKIHGRKIATLVVDGVDVERGTIQITRYINGKAKEYEVRMIANNLEWVDGLKDLYLADLPYDNPTFLYDKPTIEGSWTNTVDAGDEFVFPIINRGTPLSAVNQNVSGAAAFVEQFRPEMFVRAVLNKAFKALGYTLNSAFMDTAGFKKLILTYFGNAFRPLDVDIDNAHARVRTGNYQDTINFATIGVGSYIEKPLKFAAETPAPYTDPGNNFDIGTFTYTAPESGFYDFVMRVKASAISTTDTQLSFMYEIDTGTQIFANVITQESRPGADAAFSFDNTTEFTQQMFAGWTITFKVRYFELAVGTVPVSTFDYELASYISITLTDLAAEGTTYALADILDSDTFSMLDLCNDLSRMFNLYWTTNNAIKQVSVEPRDDFYTALTTAEDWTQYYDNSKGYELEDNSLLYNDTLNFLYATDSTDGFLKERNEIQGNTYAMQEHFFSDEFNPGSKEIKTTKAAATYFLKNEFVNGFDEDTAPVTARLWTKTGDLPPPLSDDFAPRILVYEYQAQTNTNGDARKFRFKSAFDITPPFQFTIPYALMYPFEEGGVVNAATTLNLSFGYDLSVDSLVKTHYRKTITMIDEGNRLTAWMNISPDMFHSFDFRKPIYLDFDPNIAGYWLIEQIINYTPTRAQTTQVVLIKHKDYNVTIVPSQRADNRPIDNDPRQEDRDPICVFITDANGISQQVTSLNAQNFQVPVCLNV